VTGERRAVIDFPGEAAGQLAISLDGQRPRVLKPPAPASKRIDTVEFSFSAAVLATIEPGVVPVREDVIEHTSSATLSEHGNLVLYGRHPHDGRMQMTAWGTDERRERSRFMIAHNGGTISQPIAAISHNSPLQS
jgi:hypothetical protein